MQYLAKNATKGTMQDEQITSSKRRVEFMGFVCGSDCNKIGERGR